MKTILQLFIGFSFVLILLCILIVPMTDLRLLPYFGWALAWVVFIVVPIFKRLKR